MTRFSLGRMLSQEVLLGVAIVALLIVVGIYNPRFMSTNNLSSIFVGNAYIAVAAIGISLVIISGHIDVSIGALIGVLATISGILVTNGYPVWFSWLAPIAAGCVINAVLGVFVAYLRVPSIIATLAMLSILRDLRRARRWYRALLIRQPPDGKG
jgi:AI-2 transport system permease protein